MSRYVFKLKSCGSCHILHLDESLKELPEKDVSKNSNIDLPHKTKNLTIDLRPEHTERQAAAANTKSMEVSTQAARGTFEVCCLPLGVFTPLIYRPNGHIPVSNIWFSI